jgi:hypothetical protein
LANAASTVLLKESNCSCETQVMKAKFWISSAGKKLDSLVDSREVAGKVCIYSGEDVNEAIQAAAQSKLVVLIVMQGPTTLPILPVFCLPKYLLQQLVCSLESC